VLRSADAGGGQRGERVGGGGWRDKGASTWGVSDVGGVANGRGGDDVHGRGQNRGARGGGGRERAGVREHLIRGLLAGVVGSC
jgi:hypothetical protein